MKYFSENRPNFKGIFHYLFHTKNFIPSFQTNCVEYSGHIDELITNTSKSYLLLNIDEKNKKEGYAYFIINLTNYKIITISYQFSTIINTSPPVNWSFSGTNDLNGEWTLLHSNFSENLCRNSTDSTYFYQCSNRNVVTYQIAKEYVMGPFKYFKFSVYLNRATPVNGSSFYDIRVGGFEIFGALYEEDEFIFHEKTCFVPYTFYHNLLILMSPYIVTHY